MLVVSPAHWETRFLEYRKLLAAMELAKIVAFLALVLGAVLVLGVVLATGQARAAETMQDKLVEREALRRAALAEHHKRKEEFLRRCSGKAYLTSAELEACRVAYRKLLL